MCKIIKLSLYCICKSFHPIWDLFHRYVIASSCVRQIRTVCCGLKHVLGRKSRLFCQQPSRIPQGVLLLLGSYTHTHTPNIILHYYWIQNGYERTKYHAQLLNLLVTASNARLHTETVVTVILPLRVEVVSFSLWVDTT